MEIHPINLRTNYRYCNPSFSSNVAKKAEGELIRHFTFIGRDNDLINLNKILDYAIELLCNNKGVEFVFCGCSDGSEVFDVILDFNKKFKTLPAEQQYIRTADGFVKLNMPKITAFDNQQKIIDIARRGRINIPDTSIEYLKDKHGGIYRDIHNIFSDIKPAILYPDGYIEAIKNKYGKELKYSYQFNPYLLDKIDFKVSNMVSEFGRITDDKPQIIYCRNVARYNTLEEQIIAARLLGKNLKKGSLVVVGFNDRYNYLDEKHKLIPGINENDSNTCQPLPFVRELTKNGFEPCKSLSPKELVYVKTSDSNNSLCINTDITGEQWFYPPQKINYIDLIRPPHIPTP